MENNNINQQPEQRRRHAPVGVPRLLDLLEHDALGSIARLVVVPNPEGLRLGHAGGVQEQPRHDHDGDQHSSHRHRLQDHRHGEARWPVQLLAS